MSQQPIDDRRTRLLTTLLLIVVFLAGGLIGALTMTAVNAQNADPLTAASPASPLDELDLSQDQRSAIEDILARYQPATDSIVRQSIAGMQSLMNDADREVRTVLSPAQIEAYDRILSRQPRIRAVRRTVGTGGTVVDTIR